MEVNNIKENRRIYTKDSNQINKTENEEKKMTEKKEMIAKQIRAEQKSDSQINEKQHVLMKILKIGNKV